MYREETKATFKKKPGIKINSVANSTHTHTHTHTGRIYFSRIFQDSFVSEGGASETKNINTKVTRMEAAI